MGVFSLLCPASGLAMVENEDVVLILVAAKDSEDGGGFLPIAPPLRGKYDSYGSIEDIQTVDDTTAQIGAGFASLPGADSLTGDLAALIADVQDAQVNESLMTVGGYEIGFVLILESIYSAAVAAVRRTAAGKALVATLAKASFDSLIDAALGAPEVSRTLIADTQSTRAALIVLAVFRTWFDNERGGSWAPEPLGGQYDEDELFEMAATARTDLAAWPELRSAVASYTANLGGEEEDDDDDDDEDEEEDEDEGEDDA